MMPRVLGFDREGGPARRQARIGCRVPLFHARALGPLACAIPGVLLRRRGRPLGTHSEGTGSPRTASGLAVTLLGLGVRNSTHHNSRRPCREVAVFRFTYI